MRVSLKNSLCKGEFTRDGIHIREIAEVEVSNRAAMLHKYRVDASKRLPGRCDFKREKAARDTM